MSNAPSVGGIPAHEAGIGMLYRPWPAEAPLGRVDAGVDYLKAFQGPIYAIADCVVTRIHEPGTDPAWVVRQTDA